LEGVTEIRLHVQSPGDLSEAQPPATLASRERRADTFIIHLT
jgi:hypothetical protein